MDPGPCLLHSIYNLLLFCVYFLQTFTSFHSIRLILCFRQNTVRLITSSQVGDRVLWLCCAGLHVATSTGSEPCQGSASNTFGVFPCSYWIDNLSFVLRETCCCAHHTFPLGFPTSSTSTTSHQPTRSRRCWLVVWIRNSLQILSKRIFRGF